MKRSIGLETPDLTLTPIERAADRAQLATERAAVKSLRDIEDELREQANGSQDDKYLMDIANRMRAALRHL